MKKSINTIIFYCMDLKAPFAKEFNNKPLYPCWPKLLHHPSDAAISWANSYRSKDYFTVEMPNLFEDAFVLDTVNSRYRGAKVPQAVVYNEEKDCYLQFDFRSDALVETLCEGKIEHGVITELMSFRFSSNYYFVPTNGTSFREFKESFERSQAPKSKQTTGVEIGVPFLGNYNQVHRYLGAFKCVQDDTYRENGDPSERVDYNGKTVHVYHACRNYGFRKSVVDEEKINPSFCISKSKMKVKSLEIPEDWELFESPSSGTVSTDGGSKGTYGTSGYITCVVDFENQTVKYVQAVPRRSKWHW